MLKPCLDKRGIALFMVLGTLLLVVVLANIILTIMLSHSRLTHHQVRRIQAYYATMAGVNYALEMLRLNNAPWTTAGTYNICNTNTTTCNITLPPSCTASCTVNEPNFPCSVSCVAVTVGAAVNPRQVSAKAIYTLPSP